VSQPSELRPLVATIHHKGRAYHFDGKVGTRFRDGATVFEFQALEPGYDFRLWAKADGSEIEED
jgi:hypothetical protein